MSGEGKRKADTIGRTTGRTKAHKPLVDLPSGQWLSLPREMLESPAFMALSMPGLRCIMRLVIEHLAHGGAENGKLKVTHAQFVEYGVGHNSVKPALVEVEALGFVELTFQGGRSYGGTRMPSRYRLTFPNSRNMPQTHEWSAIKTLAEARSRIARAREEWQSHKPKRRSAANRSSAQVGDTEAA